jgi:hypothetical protein
MLRWERVKNRGSEGTGNAASLSANHQRIIENRWDMLQIDDQIFFVGPGDADEIEHLPETPQE